MDAKSVGINLALVCLSVLLVLAGLEAGLRADLFGYTSDDAFTAQEFCTGKPPVFRFHSEYGVTKAPNAQLVEHRGVTDWTIHTYNEEGFRDTYDSGEENVILLGDSFMEGYLADDNATTAYLLDRWSDDVAVRNYGIGGYGTAQQLVVYRDKAPEYDHDLVVLGYYPNDLQDSARPGSGRPKFEVRSGALHKVRGPREKVADNSTDGGVTGLVNNPLVDAVQSRLHRSSEAYRFLWPRVRSLAAVVGLKEAKSPPTGDRVRRQLALGRALVGNISDVARRNRADVLILYIPNRGEVNPDNPARYDPAAARPYWEAQRRMLRNVSADRENVHFQDLTGTLRAEQDDGTRVYGEFNAHLNERGYRVVARHTHRWMRANSYADDESVNYSASYDAETATCASPAGS